MRTVFFLLLAICFNHDFYAQSLKATTFNIKFENPKEGVHQWDNRKEQIINFVHIEDLDVIGMQEVLHSQLEYFDENLTRYGRVGVARDDGKMKGEYSPIFYNKDNYTVVESDTFWLSTTPEAPSKAWDAALPRICTWARLKDVNTEDVILVLNTHFDHVGKQARANSVDLILSKIKDLQQDENVILMGDFNLEPDTEPIQKLVNSDLKDAYYEAELKVGPVGTFNGFKIGENYSRRIDYIFYSGLKPKSYKNSSLRIQDTFLSDHFPVSVYFEY